jgi:hypothetical protein
MRTIQQLRDQLATFDGGIWKEDSVYDESGELQVLRIATSASSETGALIDPVYQSVMAEHSMTVAETLAFLESRFPKNRRG